MSASISLPRLRRVTAECLPEPKPGRQAFVYGIPSTFRDSSEPTRDDRNASLEQQTTALDASEDAGETDCMGPSERSRILRGGNLEKLPECPRRNPDMLLWLSPEHQQLLQHFVQHVTRSQSCHQSIQDGFCSTLIPMALQSPHLLPAVLGVASAHRSNMMNLKHDVETARLQWRSARYLRRALEAPSSSQDDSVVATMLTLCLGDLVSGGDKPSTWRNHLQAASRLLKQRSSTKCGKRNPRSSSSDVFLQRWCLSFGILTLLTPIPLCSEDGQCLDLKEDWMNCHQIQLFNGFSTSLLPIFTDICRLAFDTHSSRGPADPEAASSGLGSENHCSRTDRYAGIIRAVKESLASQAEHLNAVAGISHEERLDYQLLNESFHHVALIHVHRRLLRKPSASSEVQFSVKSIAACVSNLSVHTNPRPVAAALQPIFTAACEACDETDRTTFMSFLTLLQTNFAVGTVPRAKEFLKYFWNFKQVNGDFEGHSRWDICLSKF